ncbi:MAG: substrate-binding domain-containing protein [Anaerolineales bacterium]|nr:substrate-binding domain-containing protein [Anaerolineales bacterium]
MRNKLVSLIFALTVLFVLAACGQSDAGSQANVCEKDRYVIAMPVVHPYLTIMNQGAEQAAADLGVELIWLSAADFNVQKQVELAESSLSMPCVVGLSVLAADPGSTETVLQTANEMGIMAHQMSGCGTDTAEWDRRAEDNVSALCYSTDFKAAGALIAERVATMMGGEGNVVISTQQPDAGQKERELAFTDYIAEHYPDIKVIGVLNDCDSPTGTVACAENALSTYPEMNAYIATGQYQAVGPVSVFPAAGRDDIIVTAYDDSPEVLEGIREGVITFSVAQQPFGQGYMMVYLNYLMREGKEPVQRFIDTGVTFIDQENVDSYMDTMKANWEVLKTQIDTELFQ